MSYYYDDSDDEQGPGEPVTLSSTTLSGVADYIKSGECKNVFVMVGAGMSVSAGIPDFRSPKTGLYANLGALGLPTPEAVFSLSFFRENPKPFFIFAKDFDPSKFRPTLAHSFLTLLHKKGLLRAVFTQNIDGLERRADLPADALVEAHGTIMSQHCIECKRPADGDKLWASIRRGEVYYCEECGHPVKPDIVFFGEALPERFQRKLPELQEADLLLVLGTSLTVYPFAALTRFVPKGCPRVLFNLEEAGDIGERSDDVLALDQCDTGVRDLARLLGWEKELDVEWATTAMQGTNPEDEKIVDAAKGEEQPKEEGLSSTAEAEDNVEKLATDIAGSLNIGNTDKSKTTTDAPSSVETSEGAKSSDDEPKL